MDRVQWEGKEYLPSLTHMKVMVINASETLKDQDEESIKNVEIQALQQQVNDHFAPAWGITAELKFIKWEQGQEYTKVMSCPEYVQNSWWLVLLDSSNITNFRGYHSVTEEGMPIGFVFAQNDNKYGRKWTVSASHELLEMLVDPGLNLTVFKPMSDGKGLLYSYEICDPC